MFAVNYSRGEKLVNGLTENFSKNHGEIALQKKSDAVGKRQRTLAALDYTANTTK